MLEDDALPSQAIEVRRKRAFGAEKAHVVGTRRVQRDKNEVGLRRTGGGSGDSERKNEDEAQEEKVGADDESSTHDCKCKGICQCAKKSLSRCS